MATVSADSNIEDVNLTNGENMTINSGAVLTVDLPNIGSDTLWSNYFRNMSIGKGCVFFIDGRSIRQLDYDSGTGDAPESGMTVTGGTSGATGEVVCVEGTGVTGYILIRSVTSGPFQDNEALNFSGGTGTPAGILADGADRVGYLRMAQQADISGAIYSGSGVFRAWGEWYEIGVGDGTASQTMDFYCDDFLPFLQVETGSGTGVFENWINLGTQWGLQAIGGDDLGRFFGQTYGSTTITFGDGTSGKVVPNGARVRVPNISLSQADQTAWPGTKIHATGYYRVDGVVDHLDWDRFSFSSNQFSGGAESIKIRDSGLMSEFKTSSKPFTVIDIDGFVVAPDSPVTGIGNQIALFHVSSVYTAGTIKNVDVANCVSSSSDSNRTLLVTNCKNLSFDSFNARVMSGSGQTVACNINNSSDLSFNNCFHCRSPFSLSTVTRVSVTSPVISGTHDGTAITTSRDAFIFNGVLNEVTVDGASIHPEGTVFYGTFYNITYFYTGQLTIKNTGTRSNPIDLQNHGEFALEVRECDQLRWYRNFFKNHRDSAEPVKFQSGSKKSGSRFWDSAFTDDTDNPRWTHGFPDADVRSLTINYNAVEFASNGFYDYSVTAGCNLFSGFKSTTEGRLIVVGGLLTPTSRGFITSSNEDTAYPEGSQTRIAENESIIYEWPYEIKGHDSFSATAPNLDTPGADGTNLVIEYQIDTGTGWSAWKLIRSAGASPTAVNLNAETISPTGFKFRVRLSAQGGDVSHFDALEILTVTSQASQDANLYEIDLATVTLDNVVVGSAYEIYNQTQETTVVSGKTAGASSVTEDVVAASGDVLRIRVRKGTEATKYKPYTGYAAVSNGVASAYVSQQPDLVAA